MSLHRRIFLFFRFSTCFCTLFSSLSLFLFPYLPRPVLSYCVCVCVSFFLSLSIFSHTCVAVLYVRVSVHWIIYYERKQLHSHVNRIIYTQAHALHFFSFSSFFFFHLPLFLFFCWSFSLSLSFQHIHITATTEKK
jgi:hypothetical protein